MPLFNWLKSTDGVITGSKILGTSPISIDLAEDREEFTKILQELNIRQPLNGIARNQIQFPDQSCLDLHQES